MKIRSFIIALAAASMIPLTAHADTTDTLTVNGSPSVGDTFTVTIRIDSDRNIGYLNSSLEYDENVIEFVDGDAIGGGGLITVYSVPDEDNSFINCVLTFSAVGEGDCNISLTNGYVFSNDGDVLEQPDSSTSVHVDASGEADDSSEEPQQDISRETDDTSSAPVVTEAPSDDSDIQQTSETPSTAAPVVQGYLISLSCSAGALSPDFSYDVFEYTVNADSSCESAELSATAAAFSDTVSFNGGSKLEYGENILTATVTAEDGTENVYTVKVIRAEGNNNASNTVKNNAENKKNTEDKYKKFLNPALAIILVTLIVALFIVLNWTMKIGKHKKK